MGKKVTLQYIADHLGVSLRTARRLVTDGELKAYKVGGHLVRIDVDDIAAVLRPIVPNGNTKPQGPPDCAVAEQPPQSVHTPPRAHQVRRARKAAPNDKTRGGAE
jgi:excisionase family DNA binding protein